MSLRSGRYSGRLVCQVAVLISILSWRRQSQARRHPRILPKQDRKIRSRNANTFIKANISPGSERTRIRLKIRCDTGVCACIDNLAFPENIAGDIVKM